MFLLLNVIRLHRTPILKNSFQLFNEIATREANCQRDLDSLCQMPQQQQSTLQDTVVCKKKAITQLTLNNYFKKWGGEEEITAFNLMHNYSQSAAAWSGA